MKNVETGCNFELKTSTHPKAWQGVAVLSSVQRNGPETGRICANSRLFRIEFGAAASGAGCAARQRTFHVWSFPAVFFDRPGH
jgi:hypothetical protein